MPIPRPPVIFQNCASWTEEESQQALLIWESPEGHGTTLAIYPKHNKDSVRKTDREYAVRRVQPSRRRSSAFLELDLAELTSRRSSEMSALTIGIVDEAGRLVEGISRGSTNLWDARKGGNTSFCQMFRYPSWHITCGSVDRTITCAIWAKRSICLVMLLLSLSSAVIVLSRT